MTSKYSWFKIQWWWWTKPLKSKKVDVSSTLRVYKFYVAIYGARIYYQTFMNWAWFNLILIDFCSYTVLLTKNETNCKIFLINRVRTQKTILEDDFYIDWSYDFRFANEHETQEIVQYTQTPFWQVHLQATGKTVCFIRPSRAHTLSETWRLPLIKCYGTYWPLY